MESKFPLATNMKTLVNLFQAKVPFVVPLKIWFSHGIKHSPMLQKRRKLVKSRVRDLISGHHWCKRFFPFIRDVCLLELRTKLTETEERGPF